MNIMIDFHKEFIKWFQKKFGVSDYGLYWIAYMEGMIVGGLIIYFIHH
tara:strand:- start:1405 stop:1548 length:144 start_codon:yes stop_codon:yes gene_type:complete